MAPAKSGRVPGVAVLLYSLRSSARLLPATRARSPGQNSLRCSPRRPPYRPDRETIRHGHWPASRDYAGTQYIEVGWGDDDGYRKPLTSGIAIKALIGSNRTVLLADGFSQAIRTKYADPKFTVLAVDLPAAGLARLCDHIQQTYALDKHGAPIHLAPGWYRARGTYSAFNTCNTWVAAGLQKAGCPITPAMCLLPAQLLARVRRFARPVDRSR